MRKLIVSMNVTLDGYISGPHCELDWHFESWSSDMGDRLSEELMKTDLILLGRTTYQVMERYWSVKLMDFSCGEDDRDFRVMINRRHKIVYSNTLQTAGWNNSAVISGKLENAVRELKRSQSDKGIMVYGSGKLVSALIQLGLVDEYHLWVHPVILGKGKPLFGKLPKKSNLTLRRSRTFGSGVVMLHYEVLHSSTFARQEIKKG